MSRRTGRRRRAFTLLEILIVVGILVLLAAMVVPSLMRRGAQARIDLARAQVGRNGMIAQGLEHYRLDVGTYPDTDDGLAALYERPDSIDDDSPMWKGPYMEGTPDDLRDPWNNEFVYKCPGDFHEDGYDLLSIGPDHEEDTDDDVKNWVEK